jgi:hypothetical protein
MTSNAHAAIEQKGGKHAYQVNFSMAMKICHFMWAYSLSATHVRFWEFKQQYANQATLSLHTSANYCYNMRLNIY